MNHQKINFKPSHYSGITYCGKSFATHFHNSYELICVLKGDVQVTINAYSTSLHQNYFLLIPPCMIHSISESENAVFFIAILTADYIPDFFERHKKNEIYMFTVESDSFSYLNDHFFQKRRPDGYLLKACLYIILAYAEKGEKLIPTRSTDYDFIFAVNLYIAEHFFEPIKRTQLAQITGYEEHYFSNLFKKNFGLNLCQYVNYHRISHALTLLDTTNINIGQIALECGFSSVKDFNNAFLRQLGQTPSEYRRKSLSTRIV